jgi:hypothetical protein
MNSTLLEVKSHDFGLSKCHSSMDIYNGVRPLVGHTDSNFLVLLLPACQFFRQLQHQRPDRVFHAVEAHAYSREIAIAVGLPRGGFQIQAPVDLQHDRGHLVVAQMSLGYQATRVGKINRHAVAQR